MDFSNLPTDVTHAIQQAVAPVFLLTGIGSLLGVLANRLVRVVDRFRTLEARPAAEQREARHEIASLRRRSRLIHRAIRFFTLGALLVCLVVSMLFIGVELEVNFASVIALLFIAAMASLIAGLVYFLREISLATAHIENMVIRPASSCGADERRPENPAR